MASGGCSLNPFLLSDGRTRPVWRFVIAILVFILTEVLAARITSLFVNDGPHQLVFNAVFRPLHLLFLIALFAMMLRFLDRVPGRPLAAQGLSRNGPWLRDTAVGCLLGSGLVALAVACIAFFGRYRMSLLPGSHAGSFVLVLWVLATAAMLEEVTFRGYPFQRLIDSVAPWLATATLALFFGLVHLGNPHASRLGAFNTVLVGIFFALAYFKTKTLWLPFGIHFAWNATMGLLFGLPVSGLTMFSVTWQGTAEGPALLTGGVYGLEASLTGTGIILLGMGVIAFMPVRQAMVPAALKPASN